MAADDLIKVRDLVRRANSTTPVVALRDHRLLQWCDWLRSAAVGRALEAGQEQTLRRAIAADLIEPGVQDIVPRLWHALATERALFELIARIEAACEVFAVDDKVLLAFVIPLAVRMTSHTGRPWRVTLDDQARRWPVALAIQKLTGASHVVVDPHMYDGPMLSMIPPRAVPDHLHGLLGYPLGSPKLPAPLVEPIAIRALAQPHWDMVYSIGVAVHAAQYPLLLRDAQEIGIRGQLLCACEWSFPMRFERLAVQSISTELKCQGVRAWHEGLRLGEASLPTRAAAMDRVLGAAHSGALTVAPGLVRAEGRSARRTRPTTDRVAVIGSPERTCLAAWALIDRVIAEGHVLDREPSWTQDRRLIGWTEPSDP